MCVWGGGGGRVKGGKGRGRDSKQTETDSNIGAAPMRLGTDRGFEIF